MKKLVVSLHDVSPLTQPACENILAGLSRLGVRQCSLLIIPNHHAIAPITRHDSFRSWLLRKIELGNEPVLHGYFHQRPTRRTDRWYSKITTEIYTAGEGEFFDLSFDSAARFLGYGLEDLAFLNRKPTGFVAPAWLLSDTAEQAVRDAGFAYTTRIGSVRIFEGCRELKSRSLVWSTRAFWRITASLCWNHLLGIAKSGAPLLRVSIHPGDFHERPVWEQVHKIIAAAINERECVTYEGLVESCGSPVSR